MRFAPAPEQTDFARSLADLLAAADTPSVARAWASGDLGPGRKLWSRLADQGVLALGLPAEHGGFGATTVDLVLAFEELGRAAVPGPLVENVAALPLLLASTPHADRLAAIGVGELIAALAAPPATPYALDAGSADAVYLLEGDHLSTATFAGPVASIDGTRRLARLTGGDLVARVDGRAALDRAALATAAQILGAGHALLARSTEYARQRRQFGRAIGSFQAVKHRLADVAVALEFARPLLFGAALAVDTPAAARDISAAKVACTDAAAAAARAALQVHGAIGYTAEYDLSIWLTKVRALTAAWGTRREHRARVWAAIASGAGS